MSAPPLPPGRPLRGVALIAVAVLLFALSDVVTKDLSTRFPVPLVQAVRYLVSLGLLVALLAPRIGARLWRTRQSGRVLLRGACLAAASLTIGLALRRMPVGETIAIVYLSPFAVMLLSWPILGERVRRASWLGAALGFAGVLLILRPGSGLDPLGVVFALLNAGCATAYHLMTRSLAKTESTEALLFHISLVGAVVFCGLALPDLGQVQPALADLGLMAALGVLSLAGHFLFTAAYREAPAATLAPVNYLHLVWAAVLGWLAFGDVPAGWSVLGIALICVGGAASALGGRLGRKPPETTAP